MGPIMPNADAAQSLLRALSANASEKLATLQKLATAQRINSGKDDPAGLIASENLRSALAVLEAESRVAIRADHVASTADGALGEVSELLNEADALAVANANSGAMSDAEREANQMQLDSIMASIDRIAGMTSFNGERLLDGTATINIDGQALPLESMALRELGAIEIDGERFALDDLQTGGAMNIATGDPAEAQQVIRAARDQVSTLRGRIGAFSANFIEPRLDTIGVAIENITAADSIIRDTDFARETAELARIGVIEQAQFSALDTLLTNRGKILQLLG